jgi:hypothetical protein
MRKSDKYVKGKGGYVYGKPGIDKHPLNLSTGEVVLNHAQQKALFKELRNREAMKRSVPDTSPLPSFSSGSSFGPSHPSGSVYMWFLIIFLLIFYLISLFVN